MKKGGEIRILDVVDGKMILMVIYNDRKFLFLPAINQKIARTIEWMDIGPIDALILPGFYARNEELVREITKKLKPALVTAPFISPELQEFFVEEKIQKISLEREGSLRIALRKQFAGFSISKMLY